MNKKNAKSTPEQGFLTRAKLISDRRKSNELDKLPKPSKDMFDCLGSFKQGTREFIDLSKC